MATYNRITLLGNVAAEPRSSVSGKTADVYLAVNGTRKEDQPLFINVRTFNQTAQFVMKYVTKGASILVEGKLEPNTYTDKSGREQKQYRIAASSVQLIGGKREDTQRRQEQYPPTYDDDCGGEFDF